MKPNQVLVVKEGPKQRPWMKYMDEILPPGSIVLSLGGVWGEYPWPGFPYVGLNNAWNYAKGIPVKAADGPLINRIYDFVIHLDDLELLGDL